MISADKILSWSCLAGGCSLMRNRTSVLHFKNPPKYAWTCFQYLSESELAVGMKRSLGFFFCESRMISRSIPTVPFVLISPPPMATITFNMELLAVRPGQAEALRWRRFLCAAGLCFGGAGGGGAGAASRLSISAATFHDPSACFFHTVTYFPFSSVISPFLSLVAKSYVPYS